MRAAAAFSSWPVAGRRPEDACRMGRIATVVAGHAPPGIWHRMPRSGSAPLQRRGIFRNSQEPRQPHCPAGRCGMREALSHPRVGDEGGMPSGMWRRDPIALRTARACKTGRGGSRPGPHADIPPGQAGGAVFRRALPAGDAGLRAAPCLVLHRSDIRIVSPPAGDGPPAARAGRATLSIPELKDGPAGIGHPSGQLLRDPRARPAVRVPTSGRRGRLAGAVRRCRGPHAFRRGGARWRPRCALRDARPRSGRSPAGPSAR